MNYYIIEPEVAGEIGEKTVYENVDGIVNNHEKPIIKHLHFVFEGWLGDELLEVTPCFLASERLKNEIELCGFSGCSFEEIEVSFSYEFFEMYPKRVVPKFYRLLPKKELLVENATYSDSSLDDFMVSQKSYLIVSDRVKRMFNFLHIDNYADYTLLKK